MKSQYLVFNISKENYLIDISKVREVISISKFERVPNADSYILGVINLRGEVISIINSSVILNTHIENINSPSNKIIILEHLNEHVGLVVENVTRVMEIEKESIEAPPLYNEDSTYVSGVVQENESLYIVVDIEHKSGAFSNALALSQA